MGTDDMTKAEILTLQRDLKARGYSLVVDGVYGPATAEAYQDWLDQHTPQEVNTPAPPAAKPWYLSRAVIGILVSLIAVITERMGWIVDANTLTTLAVQLAEVAGLALAFLGTVKRRAAIDPSLVLPGLRLPTRASQVPADDTDVSHLKGPFGY